MLTFKPFSIIGVAAFWQPKINANTFWVAKRCNPAYDAFGI